MRKIMPLLTMLVPLAFCLQAIPAQAQLSRTFVSAATGSDANNCDRPTPCRTFQGAHDKTNDQGEITVLDTGGYGAVTITKSISIVSEVGEASILVSGGGTGITINASPSNGRVNLRGLTVQGIGFGTSTGLTFTTGLTLTITNCVFRNNTRMGLAFVPSVSSTLSVANTVVADNGDDGIEIGPTAGSVQAIMSGVLAYNNGNNGIVAVGTFSSGGFVHAVVSDSVASNNFFTGFYSVSGAVQTTMMVIRCVAAFNDVGMQANGGPATLRVGQSSITHNTNAWEVFGGAFLSYGDNNIDGNVGGDPSPPVIGKK